MKVCCTPRKGLINKNNTETPLLNIDHKTLQKFTVIRYFLIGNNKNIINRPRFRRKLYPQEKMNNSNHNKKNNLYIIKKISLYYIKKQTRMIESVISI